MKRHPFIADMAMWLVLYLFWITVLQNRALTLSRTLTIEFCYLLFIGGIYYFSIYFTIPKYLNRGQYFLFGLTLAASIITGSILRTWLAMFMNRRFFLAGKPQPHFSTIFLNSLVNIFVWVVCLLALRVIIEKIRFRKYVNDIENEKTKNELDFLRAQINPHFLFNSINSIYGHIEKANPTARNMLLKFSEMLRYQLYECSADRISIDKEINYIRNYVALQQARKEENLVIHLNINRGVSGFKIAPLLFIGFIENAFKYVSSNEFRENKVEILLDRDEDDLLFKIYNTKEISGSQVMEHGGIGINNAKRRLELLYPEQYNLSILNTDDSFQVALKIKIA
jgi:two-component system LytT family sensor kinase